MLVLLVEIRRQSQKLAISRSNNVAPLYAAINGNSTTSTTQNGHSRASLLQAPTKLPPPKQQRYTLDPSCFEVDSLTGQLVFLKKCINVLLTNRVMK